MEPASTEKKDSRGSSQSSTSPTESSSGPSGVIRRRGSLFELVTGRPEPPTTGRNLSGSDNAINTRHRVADSRLKTPNPIPVQARRPSGVTIVRPTKEARKAEIVAAVTRRLYTARKKPELRPEVPPSVTESAEDSDTTEPKELQLCSNARARLQEISKRAIALGLHRKLRKDSDTQTEELKCALRVKEKSVCTDEPTKEIAVETVSLSVEANLCMDVGKRVEMAEKSSQWKAESASVGTQLPLLLPPMYHFVPTLPVCAPPYWMNPWWPNVPWDSGCCHHETKRRANVSAADSAEEAFSDDSLESLCGLSRVPDGSAGDSVLPEDKPALWETLTLRSGCHFKEEPSLYQPDVFKTQSLASIFPKHISQLCKEDKCTETELPQESTDNEQNIPKEVGCNTDQTAANLDETFPLSCPVHSNFSEDSAMNQDVRNAKPSSPKLGDSAQVPPPARFQLVCDFTVACHPFNGQNPAKLTFNTQIRPDGDPKWSRGCTCRHDPIGNDELNSNDQEGDTCSAHQMFTAVSSEVSKHEDAPSSSSSLQYDPRTVRNDQKPSAQVVGQAQTPFSTPDIIAQARNDTEIGDTGMMQSDCDDERNGSLDLKLVHKASEPSGWEAGCDRPFNSLDSSLLHHRRSQPSNPFRAHSVEGIFQPQNNPDNGPTPEPTRPVPNNGRKFRLPYLSETKNQPVATALVTARAIDEPPPQLNPTLSNNFKNPPKRITPPSFLSPNGRRLLLTWLNNPGSNPPSSASMMKTARKTITGKVTRRRTGPRDKNRKKVTGTSGETSSGEKTVIYQNLSLLLNEATNYVRTLNKNSEIRENHEEHAKNKSHATFTTQTESRHCASQTENQDIPPLRDPTSKDRFRKGSPTVKIKSNSAATQTHENKTDKSPSLVKKESLGTQCDLNSGTNPRNTFVLSFVSRSTQTEEVLWSDYDLQEDFSPQEEPLASEEAFVTPYFYPNYHDRIAEFNEMTHHKTTAMQDLDSIVSDISDDCGRSPLLLPPDEWPHRSRLPCQHSSPRLYLQHLVSLRKGVVEASQSPARPTGVG